MGQQQLLLLVLAIIVVGIAIIVGITQYNTHSVNLNRDAVIAELNNYAVMAQQYYKKPTTAGGGGNTFTGWTLPANLETTSNGTYKITVKAQSVTIRGTGNEIGNDNDGYVKSTVTVTPTDITIKINN